MMITVDHRSEGVDTHTHSEHANELRGLVVHNYRRLATTKGKDTKTAIIMQSNTTKC